MTKYKYTIDKGYPIPKTPYRRPYMTTGENIRLLRRMQILDSVGFPGLSPLEVTNKFYNVAKREGMMIKVMQTPKGPRMWRIK